MARSDVDKAPIFMVRTPTGLKPAGPFDAERLDSYAFGSTVEVSIKQRRSLPQLRLYWSVLAKAVDNLDGYPSAEALHEALKLHLGYVEPLLTVTGQKVWRPMSASFAKMSAEEFRVFFDRAVDVLATMLGCDPLELTTEARREVA